VCLIGRASHTQTIVYAAQMDDAAPQADAPWDAWFPKKRGVGGQRPQRPGTATQAQQPHPQATGSAWPAMHTNMLGFVADNASNIDCAVQAYNQGVSSNAAFQINIQINNQHGNHPCGLTGNGSDLHSNYSGQGLESPRSPVLSRGQDVVWGSNERDRERGTHGIFGIQGVSTAPWDPHNNIDPRDDTAAVQQPERTQRRNRRRSTWNAGGAAAAAAFTREVQSRASDSRSAFHNASSGILVPGAGQQHSGGGRQHPVSGISTPRNPGELQRMSVRAFTGHFPAQCDGSSHHIGHGSCISGISGMPAEVPENGASLPQAAASRNTADVQSQQTHERIQRRRGRHRTWNAGSSHALDMALSEVSEFNITGDAVPAGSLAAALADELRGTEWKSDPAETLGAGLLKDVIAELPSPKTSTATASEQWGDELLSVAEDEQKSAAEPIQRRSQRRQTWNVGSKSTPISSLKVQELREAAQAFSRSSTSSQANETRTTFAMPSELPATEKSQGCIQRVQFVEENHGVVRELVAEDVLDNKQVHDVQEHSISKPNSHVSSEDNLPINYFETTSADAEFERRSDSGETMGTQNTVTDISDVQLRQDSNEAVHAPQEPRPAWTGSASPSSSSCAPASSSSARLARKKIMNQKLLPSQASATPSAVHTASDPCRVAGPVFAISRSTPGNYISDKTCTEIVERFFQRVLFEDMDEISTDWLEATGPPYKEIFLLGQPAHMPIQMMQVPAQNPAFASFQTIDDAAPVPGMQGTMPGMQSAMPGMQGAMPGMQGNMCSPLRRLDGTSRIPAMQGPPFTPAQQIDGTITVPPGHCPALAHIPSHADGVASVLTGQTQGFICIAPALAAQQQVFQRQIPAMHVEAMHQASAYTLQQAQMTQLGLHPHAMGKHMT